MVDVVLTADDIEKLLTALESALRRKGSEGRIFIVGGAAMVLAYNAGRSTGDIDGVMQPREVVLDAAREVAATYGLPQTWLSDGVLQMHMPPRADDHPLSRRIGPALTIEIASAEYVLAMKAMSTRLSDGDLKDAARLCAMLGFTDEAEIEAVIRRYYGSADVFGAQELWFERIIAAAAEGDF